MPSIAWSFSAGDSAGAGLSASGTLDAGAVTTAAATVEADDSVDLALQLDDIARVALLVVTCSRYDGSVSLAGGGSPALAMTGPIVAFGAAAQRIAASLQTVTLAAAAAPAQPATVNFFIATRLT